MTDNKASVPISDDTPLDQAVPSNSKYLGKDDVFEPMLVQIWQMTTDEVDGDAGAIEQRAVLHFHGDVKPMILNQTNKELLKAITGATTAGGVKNHQIILYNDPTIMFGRKMVGGLRIRSAQQQPAPMAYPAATPTGSAMKFTRAKTAPLVPAPATPTEPTDVPFDDGIPY